MQHQVNNPQKGHKVDACWKVYFKHDGCSMLLFKNLTYFSATSRTRALKKLYNGWLGSFIITK